MAMETRRLNGEGIAPQAEDYYLYGRMLVRCFLDEVVGHHGWALSPKRLDANVHHSEISKIHQANIFTYKCAQVNMMYMYTHLCKDVFMMCICVCQHIWLKHRAVLWQAMR